MNDFSNTLELSLLATPIPKRTDTYSPVPHRDIILEIQEQMDRRNMSVSNKQYRSARNGQRVIGYFDVNSGDSDMGFRFGFKNSYDKSMSLGMVAGNTIWICSNGMMSGSIQFVRKHTGEILQEIRQKINETLDKLEIVFDTHKRDKERMESIELNDMQRNSILGSLFFEKNVLTPHQTPIIKKELENPEYPEFRNDNLWGVYNKITHAFKKSHPDHYIEDHINLHKFVEEEYLCS